MLIISTIQQHSASICFVGELNIWYRHSGEPEIERIPDFYACNFKTVKSVREIAWSIGNHFITHMYIRNGDIPDLGQLAPKLTHLRIDGNRNYSPLQRYVLKFVI